MKRVVATAGAAALLLLATGAAGKKSIVPRYETLLLKNGAKVYWFPSPNIPLFEVHLNFRGGSDLDPPGRSGIAAFAAGMIRRGVPGLDENAISSKLDDTAGGVEASVGEEDTTVSSYGLNEHAPEILDLMFEELAHPTFPEEPFKRLRTNHLDSIVQLPDSPGALATHVLDSVMFNGTTKARPSTGYKRDLVRVKLDAVRDYYPTLVRTDKLAALVIGGKERREILDRVARGLEALPCPACGKTIPEPGPVDLPPARLGKGTVLLVSRPGISEAHVRMGFVGPRRKVAEFYDLRVAETILSGHFASRLNLVIREKLGLTYGINAGFNFGTTVGSFVLSTSTRNDKVGELITQVNKLLAAFVRGEIGEDDLRIAKDYLTGSFPLGLQNVYAIAGSVFGGVLNGLEPAFLDDFQDRVNGVTLESLRAAVRKHVTLDQLKTVVVGDVKALSPRLAKHGLRYVVRKPGEFL
ncbi:MAG: insulinase family protein [Deltaproteobacteria bacterium]|nr:insulinase family protein [Deltaproteobacteria bacterium]